MASQELPSFITASTFVTTVNGVPSTGVTTMVVSSDLPTQALPPYLSASSLTTVVGGVSTVVVSTVEVPITYFGPSIPLGTNGVWTFGGSTSPASTSLTSTATATPSTSLTSTSSGAITSSSVSESSSTSVTSNPSSGSSAVSTSASSTSVGSAPTSGSVSKSSTLHRALPGIIIAAVVVAVAFVMLLCLWRYRRRRRALEYDHPNLSDFVIVDNEGHPRLAGEGVPRTTGEEEDSFLRRSGDATDGMQQADTSARLVTIPSRSGTVVSTGTTPLPEGVVPTALKSVSSKGSPTLPHGAASPFFHASASSLFFNPSRGPDQAVVGAAAVSGGKRDSASTRHSTSSASPVIGSIIPTRQLLLMEDDWKHEDASATPIAARRGTTELGERVDEYGEFPLRPPPTLNPDGPVTARPPSMFGTVGSNPESPGSELDEAATLLTARRVMMNEGGPTTLVEVGNNGNGSGPSSWGSSIAHGLGGLTRLSRLSWFQRMEAMRSHSPAREAAGRSQSRPSTPGTSQRRPTSLAERAGLTVPRPISHLSVGSGKSSNGDTVFYDALSSVSTRSGHGHGPRPSSMPPLPRPLTATPTQPASTPNTPPAHDTSSGSQVHFDQPVAPSPIHASPARSRDPTPPNTAAAAAPAPSVSEVLDVLDTPVPSAVSPFSTASSRGGPAYPPGLEQHISNIRAWRESSSDMPSAASFGTGSASGRGGSFAVVGAGPDILEEEPPRPGEGWTHLRSVTSGTVDTGRRTTLGQPILIDLNDDDLDLRHRSEQGSLHSMPDRLSPLSPAGSGSNSRAPSRHTFYGSSTYSSGSSRSPGHLTPREGSGSSSQLAHSNSITSDGRRRPRREAGEPLSPSTPGSSAYGRARLSALGGPRSTVTSPQLSPAHDATFPPGITGAPSTSTMSDSAGGLSGASHTSRSTLVEPTTSDILPHATVHWPASGEILPL